MAFFDWKDSLTVGNPMIDRDHKMLIQYVNEMHQAMTAGKGKEIVGRILNNLVSYTRAHFGREEIVWKAGHYADFDAHKQRHADLLSKVDKFKAEYDSGNGVITVEVMNFLRDRLINHIMKSDQAAAEAIATARASKPSLAHAAH